jgi:L-aspartate oxidase
LTSELIVKSARARHESRGLHASRDYPGLLPEARDTVLSPTEIQTAISITTI